MMANHKGTPLASCLSTRSPPKCSAPTCWYKARSAAAACSASKYHSALAGHGYLTRFHGVFEMAVAAPLGNLNPAIIQQRSNDISDLHGLALLILAPPRTPPALNPADDPSAFPGLARRCYRKPERCNN